MTRGRQFVAAITAAGVIACGLALTGSVAADDSVHDAPTRELTGSASGLALPTGIDVDGAGNSVVTNFGLDSVTVHAATASGGAAPLRTISGDATGISLPTQVDVDAAGVTYVASASPAAVRVFAAGATGNVAPVRSITGAATRMDLPYGVAAGPDGTVYVANTQGASVTVYGPGASGNAAPVRTISGTLTRLSQPSMLALAGGLLYVGDRSGAVAVFAATANGNVAPTRYISGSATGLGDVVGVAVDSSGDVYAASYDSNSVAVFGPTATGNATPVRTLVGSATGLDHPLGIALDDRGALRVANFETSSVLTFGALVAPPTPTPPTDPGSHAKPGVVTALRVTGKDSAATRKVKWAASTTDGGARITGYTVVVRQGKTVVLTTNATPAKTKVKLVRTALPTGKLKVLVSATNSVGTGAVSKVKFKVKRASS